jgi:hypothetical protein
VSSSWEPPLGPESTAGGTSVVVAVSEVSR